MSEHFPMDEEICSAVLEEPLSGAVEERNTAEECEAPAPSRVAWGNNTSENHSKWMIFHADVLRVWNAGKRLFQTNETQVCAFVPSQELPHTPSVKPTDPLETRPTDPPRWSPGRLTRSCPGRRTRPVQVQADRPAPLESRPTDRSCESLYEVVKKLKSRGDRWDYLGFRNPDIKRVIISYIAKSQPEKLVELPGYTIPLSRDAAAMLMLQKSPTSTHIIQLYDIFVMEDQDVLVLDYPHHRMTLYEFVQQNRGSLTEHSVKYIVQQLVVALQHCLDHGVYHKTHMMNVLVNPNTLKVKLMDFGNALFFEERPGREYAVRAVTDIHKLLDALVPRKGHWFWQRSHLSKECLDLLEKLNDRRSRMTLDAILHHDWFKNPSKR